MWRVKGRGFGLSLVVCERIYWDVYLLPFVQSAFAIRSPALGRHLTLLSDRVKSEIAHRNRLTLDNQNHSYCHGPLRVALDSASYKMSPATPRVRR